MKKALFAVCLVMLTACTNKLGTNGNASIFPEDSFNGLDQIYDFSDVDTENTRYWEAENNGWLPINEYKYVGGSKYVNGENYHVIIIFDQHTKKPIYQYIDYEKPESYSAYGEEYVYDYESVSLALLSDRLVILIQYRAGTKQRTDYVQIYRDGSNTRKTIEKGAAGLMIKNLSDDTILFYGDLHFPIYFRSYIYIPSTSEVIFQGPFCLAQENGHGSITCHDINHYIVSETTPLRFIYYNEHAREIQEGTIEDLSFTHPDIKQIILQTGTTALPFDEMFENFTTNEAQNPDIIEFIKCEKLSYYSMLIEYQRTAFSGQKDTCSVIASIDKDGKTVFEIRK